jgi:hypothetical protein
MALFYRYGACSQALQPISKSPLLHPLPHFLFFWKIALMILL